MPARFDETPTADVVLNMLAGLVAGVLLIALGGAIRAVDDNRPEI